MTYGNFSYLVYMTIFAIGPVALIMFMHRKILRKYADIMVKILLFGIFVIYLPWDNLAVATGAWSYPPEKNIGWLIFLSPIESLIFTIVLTLGISSVTIILYESSKRNI